MELKLLMYKSALSVGEKTFQGEGQGLDNSRIASMGLLLGTSGSSKPVLRNISTYVNNNHKIP